MEYTNTINHTITCNESKSNVEFLNTKVILDLLSNELYMILYTKLRDTRNVLHYTLAHRLSTTLDGPYGQSLRIRHMYSKDNDFKMEFSGLFQAYRKRGYPKHIMDKHVHRPSLCNQDDL